jgi:hypothetical protein
MADQVGLAPAPGEDNSSFATKAADVAQRVALPPLPIAQAARAVGRMFGGPKRDDIPD